MKKKNYLIPEIAVFTDVSTMPLMAGSDTPSPATFTYGSESGSFNGSNDTGEFKRGGF